MNFLRKHSKISSLVIILIAFLITVGTNVDLIKLKLNETTEISELFDAEEKGLEKELEEEAKLFNDHTSYLTVFFICIELYFQPLDNKQASQYLDQFTPPPEQV